MNESAVDRIWQQIQTLGEDEQLRLHDRLSAVADQRWREETAAARQIAHAKGIDQAVIDRTIDQVRYGR